MMRPFILLMLFFIGMTLNVACGKTGELYLPGDSSGENDGVAEKQDKAPSSKTDSTTGR